MPANRRTPWLVCYDIADPARLQRVHRAISRRAIPFQHSVFYADATRSSITDLFDELASHIDPRHDDVRAYPLLTTARPFVYGRSRLPDRVMLLGQAGLLFHNLRSFGKSQPGGSEVKDRSHAVSFTGGPRERNPRRKALKRKGK